MRVGKLSEPVLLIAIVILSTALRLHDIGRPLADWPSWRQADTASVSRNWVKDGIDIWHPKYDDLSSFQSGLYNYDRYRMVEFPIYNVIVTLVWQKFGVVEAYARLVSIVISQVTLVLLYFLARKYFGPSLGILTAFVFAIMPYNIFYSTTILPEPLLLATSTATLYFFSLYTDRLKKRWYFLTLFSFALAMLTKPTAIFIVLPLSYLAYKKWGLKMFKNKSLWILAVVSLLPFILWRLWIAQFSEGIPASGWLFNGDGIRLRPAFFRWLLVDRFGRLIFTVCGLPLLAIGLLTKFNKGNYIFHFWFLSVLLYFVVFATGNVRHDYYQIPIIPVGSFFVSFGAYQLWQNRSIVTNIWLSRIAAIFLIVFFYAFGWYEAKQLFGINDPAIVEAGARANQILPKDARVIAPYQQNTAFLYQTHRYGWPDFDRPLDDLIKAGATHVIAINIDGKVEGIMKKYTVVEKTDKYVIVDLTRPR